MDSGNYVKSFGLLQFEAGIKLVAPCTIKASFGHISHNLSLNYIDKQPFVTTLYLRRTTSLGFPYCLEIFPPASDNDIKITIHFENIVDVEVKKGHILKFNYRGNLSVSLQFKYPHDYNFCLNYYNMLQIWNGEKPIRPFVSTVRLGRKFDINQDHLEEGGGGLSPIPSPAKSKMRFFGISQTGRGKNEDDFMVKAVKNWSTYEFLSFLNLIPYQEFYDDFLNEERELKERLKKEEEKTTETTTITTRKRLSSKGKGSTEKNSSEEDSESEDEGESDNEEDYVNFNIDYYSLYFEQKKDAEMKSSSPSRPPCSQKEWKKGELQLRFRIITVYEKLTRSHPRSLQALEDFFEDELVSQQPKPMSLYIEFQKNVKSLPVNEHLQYDFFEYLSRNDILLLHRIFTHLEYVNKFWGGTKININWYRVFAKLLQNEIKVLLRRLRESDGEEEEEEDEPPEKKEEEEKEKKSGGMLRQISSLGTISTQNQEENEAEKKRLEEEMEMLSHSLPHPREMFDLFDTERKVFFCQKRKVWDTDELVNTIMMILITGQDESELSENLNKGMNRFNNGRIKGRRSMSDLGERCMKYGYLPSQFFNFLKQLNSNPRYSGVPIDELDYGIFYTKYINEKYRVEILQRREKLLLLRKECFKLKQGKDRVQHIKDSLLEKSKKKMEKDGSTSAPIGVALAIQKLEKSIKNYENKIEKYKETDLPLMKTSIIQLEKELYDIETSRNRMMDIYFEKFLKPNYHSKITNFENYIEGIYEYILTKAMEENPLLRYSSSKKKKNMSTRRNFSSSFSNSLSSTSAPPPVSINNEEEEDVEKNPKGKKDLLEMKLKLVITRNTNLKSSVPNRLLRMGASALDFLNLTESYTFGLYHSYLQLKNVQFHFFDNSLIYVGELRRMKNLQKLSDLQEIVCLDLDATLICNFDVLKKFVRILSEEIIHWNSYIVYSEFNIPIFQKKNYKKNCQEFVLEFIKLLHGSPFYPETKEYLEEIKGVMDIDRRETNIRYLKVNKLFYETFKDAIEKGKLKVSVEEELKKIHFQSHYELDDFVFECARIDPSFDRNYGGYYQLLKGFDRAFWMRASSSKEKNSIFIQPSKRGCPFNVGKKEVEEKELKLEKE